MRFFVSPEFIFPDEKKIKVKNREELHHIKDVMRLEKGVRVTVFDGKGREYKGVIENICSKSAEISIESVSSASRESGPEITLYQAIPKKSKIDFIIEKCVELGVTRIVPVITQRTIPVIKKNSKKKIERWNKIARAASKQSGRTILTDVTDVVFFGAALESALNHDIVIFCALSKERISLKNILKGHDYKSIGVFVGPEGDFSPRETAMAREKGYSLCSLGNLVLKVETAAIYLISCLNYQYHD